MIISEEKIKPLLEFYGFSLAGVFDLSDSPRAAEAEKFIADGRQGDMSWLKRQMPIKIKPRERYGEYQSALVLAVNYFTADLPTEISQDPSRGLIARYAWFSDYHKILTTRLKNLFLALKKIYPELEGRWYADTGPILEKEWAARSGLGFIGKNTLFINEFGGSYYFLCELILNQKIEPLNQTEKKYRAGGCGACTRCAVACPTEAIISPYQLDARKCLAYLTIEHRGLIEIRWHKFLGNKIFGCDICQEVCPWNSRAKRSFDPAWQPKPEQQAPYLLDLINLNEAQFKHRFSQTAILRTTWPGFIRNVLIALGNWGSDAALKAIEQKSSSDKEVIRCTAEQILLKHAG